MTVEICSVCGDFDMMEYHKCKPAWECRFAKDGPIYFDEEWTKIRAIDAEDAAEQFCDSYDCEGGEYRVLSLGESNPPTVEVRKPGEERIDRFVVVGTSEPTYRAESVE